MWRIVIAQVDCTPDGRRTTPELEARSRLHMPATLPRGDSHLLPRQHLPPWGIMVWFHVSRGDREFCRCHWANQCRQHHRSLFLRVLVYLRWNSLAAARAETAAFRKILDPGLGSESHHRSSETHVVGHNIWWRGVGAGKMEVVPSRRLPISRRRARLSRFWPPK